MIEIKDLVKQYENTLVLNEINLHIKKGEIFGLIGRSGTGKSTLLRCINGLESYGQGTLLVDHTNIKDLSENQLREFRKEIGMVFQQFSLLERLTVFENIALPLKCWHYKETYIKQKVEELLEIIGIPEKANSRPRELSGGQKQRVAIARALALEPKLLLCDEATSALDPNTTKSIISLLKKINQSMGITIVIVTHQMSVLRNACERMAIIENGKIEALGKVEDVFFERPQALCNLIGSKKLILPEDGINIELFYSQADVTNPIITKMARELNVDCWILGGESEKYNENSLGSIIINIPENDCLKITEYLTSSNIRWRFLNKG